MNVSNPFRVVTKDNTAEFLAAVEKANYKPLASRLSMIMFVEGYDGQASHILMARNENPKTGAFYYDLPTTKKGTYGSTSISCLQSAISKKYGLPKQLIDETKIKTIAISEIDVLKERYDPESKAHYAMVETPILFASEIKGHFKSVNGVEYSGIADFEEAFTNEARGKDHGNDVEIVAMPFADAFKILTKDRGVPVEAFEGLIESHHVQHKLGLISDNEYNRELNKISKLDKEFEAAQRNAHTKPQTGIAATADTSKPTGIFGAAINFLTRVIG